jgi:hypothetical protein
MRFCNSFRRPFLIAGPAATQMRVPSLLLILGERQFTSASAGKLTGRNIPSSATPRSGFHRIREAGRTDNSEYSGTRNIGQYSVNGILSVSCLLLFYRHSFCPPIFSLYFTISLVAISASLTLNPDLLRPDHGRSPSIVRSALAGERVSQ